MGPRGFQVLEVRVRVSARILRPSAEAALADTTADLVPRPQSTGCLAWSAARLTGDAFSVFEQASGLRLA